jgi:murein DD-endopeptidase MepM/ murein hydrolase activator NlpD
VRATNLRAASTAAIAALAWVGLVWSAQADEGHRRDRLEAVEKVVDIVSEKQTERQADFRSTTARIYRLLRPQRGQSWGRRSSIRDRTWRRAWMSKVLAIKKVELQALTEELELVRRNQLVEQRPVSWESIPALLRPVPGPVVSRFGSYRHTSGARLLRRGIRLATSKGETVRAPQGGVVDYVGEVRGLGPTILLSCSHGPRVVLGGVTARVAIGDRVESGHELGRAVSSNLYMELRVGAGAGEAVDPGPHLRTK